MVYISDINFYNFLYIVCYFLSCAFTLIFFILSMLREQHLHSALTVLYTAKNSAWDYIYLSMYRGREVTNQTLPVREKVTYSRPGRVWLVTARLGKIVNFFTVYSILCYDFAERDFSPLSMCKVKFSLC
jgi:hypothetical protein